jgi:hypothetical protein
VAHRLVEAPNDPGERGGLNCCGPLISALLTGIYYDRSSLPIQDGDFT